MLIIVVIYSSCLISLGSDSPLNRGASVFYRAPMRRLVMPMTANTSTTVRMYGHSVVIIENMTSRVPVNRVSAKFVMVVVATTYSILVN